MKTLHFISITIFSILLFSCNKDDDQNNDPSGNTDISNTKIDLYTVQPYNNEAYVEDISYLENGNNSKFSYPSPHLIEYVNSEGGTYPNGEPRFSVQFQLDSNGKVTTIVSKPQLQWSYRYVLTYNAENYLDEMTIYETRLSDQGYPMEEPQIFQYEKLTWENENLVGWHSKSYNDDGEIYHEAKRTYSGFLSENINTLGVKNFGFNFFGKGGIPMYFLGEGQYYAFFRDQMFAGKLVPTEMVYDVLSSNAPDVTTNYRLVKDSKGRIKECKIEDGPTWWQNKIYTYED